MSEVEQPLNLSASGSVFASSTTGGSILVIDDEAGIRESLEVLLTLEGYSVRMAADGEQGLRILELENFDLVLLDLALARPERPRTAAADQGTPARDAGHHDHGLRHRGQRRRGRPRRR